MSYGLRLSSDLSKFLARINTIFNKDEKKQRLQSSVRDPKLVALLETSDVFVQDLAHAACLIASLISIVKAFNETLKSIPFENAHARLNQILNVLIEVNESQIKIYEKMYKLNNTWPPGLDSLKEQEVEPGLRFDYLLVSTFASLKDFHNDFFLLVDALEQLKCDKEFDGSDAEFIFSSFEGRGVKFWDSLVKEFNNDLSLGALEANVAKRRKQRAVGGIKEDGEDFELTPIIKRSRGGAGAMPPEPRGEPSPNTIVIEGGLFVGDSPRSAFSDDASEAGERVVADMEDFVRAARLSVVETLPDSDVEVVRAFNLPVLGSPLANKRKSFYQQITSLVFGNPVASASRRASAGAGSAVREVGV